MDGLTVGRVVHYVHDSTRLEQSRLANTFVQVPDPLKGTHEAAIVSAVPEPEKGRLHLHVFQPDGFIQFRPDVPYSEKGEPNTWHWMERVTPETRPGLTIEAPAE